MDRDCDKCVYHTSGSCSKWECDFTTISDIRNRTIDEIAEKIGKIFKMKECEIARIAEQMKAGI